MNSSKSEHKPKAHSHPHPQAEPAAEPMQSSPHMGAETPGNAALIESLDSLARKLDSFSGALAELMNAPIQPTGANTTAGASSISGPGAIPASAAPSAQPFMREGSSISDAPDPVGLQTSAAKVSSLVDKVSQSRNAWAQQAGAVQSSLEAIMRFLESEAAIEEPKMDLSDIMSRLGNLEEQQRNLQMQFNASR